MPFVDAFGCRKDRPRDGRQRRLYEIDLSEESGPFAKPELFLLNMILNIKF